MIINVSIIRILMDVTSPPSNVFVSRRWNFQTLQLQWTEHRWTCARAQQHLGGAAPRELLGLHGGHAARRGGGPPTEVGGWGAVPTEAIFATSRWYRRDFWKENPRKFAGKNKVGEIIIIIWPDVLDFCCHLCPKETARFFFGAILGGCVYNTPFGA